MANHLEHLGRRMEDDPFFVACPLALYAKSERLDDDALASRLRCSSEALALVRLCRAPAAEADSFMNDIEWIAAKFTADADVLAEAIRHGQALLQMRHRTDSTRTLLAARDGSEQPPAENDGGAEP